MFFERYRESLAEFIHKYNNTPHKRPTLDSVPIVPMEDYKRIYTTRYEISPKTLALFLMKSERRKIGKLGVQCFRDNWFYNHEAMAVYKGQFAEVRYSEDDYKQVFVSLPNSQICEAKLITPTSIINPNQQTLKVVKQMQARVGKLSPHDLRRTAITKALDQGLTYRQVQMMSGHRDPKTVMRYDHGRENLELNAANFLQYETE